MRNYFQDRLLKTCKKLKEGEALYVNLPEEVYYLSGFTGEDSSILIIPGGAYFITDGRYVEQFNIERKIDASLEEVKPGRRLIPILKSLICGLKISTLLLSRREISLEFADELRKALAPDEPELRDSKIIKDMRIRKDDYEIEIIRNNLMITELGYNIVLPLIKEGCSENEIAAELEFFLRKKGAKGQAFDTIVASGPRSAMPHGTATGKKIQKNEIILLDFGIKKDGYCSDFTRCYNLGKIIDPKIIVIHKIVLKALKKAEAMVKDGVKAGEVHEPFPI